MITPSFSSTATERVLPKLALDFTTGTLDPRVTFTRASTGTYFNSSGVMQTAAINAARFDYNPVTKIPLGLLIEEERLNIIQYSQEFDNAYWTKARSTVSANAAVAPDGTSTADKLVEDTTAANTHYILRGIAPATSTAYTGTVYAKAGERRYLFFQFLFGGLNTYSWFDLLTGVMNGATGGGTFTCTDVGNGWYRCSCTATTLSTATGNFAILMTETNSSITYNGNGTSGLYLWGAQLEAGAFATSYIPTSGGTATRNADVASMTGTNFSSWYNQTQGSVVVIGSGAKGQYPMAFGITETVASINNQYCCFINNGTTPVQDIWSGGVSQVSLNSGAVITSGGRFAVASAVKTDSFAGCAVAGTVQTDNSGTLPSVMTRLNIGSRNDVLQLNGWVQKVMYYPQRLTNAEVQAFSK